MHILGDFGLGSKVKVTSHWLVTTTAASCSFPLLWPSCSPFVAPIWTHARSTGIASECFCWWLRQKLNMLHCCVLFPLKKKQKKTGLFFFFRNLIHSLHHWSLTWWIKIWKSQTWGSRVAGKRMAPVRWAAEDRGRWEEVRACHSSGSGSRLEGHCKCAGPDNHQRAYMRWAKRLWNANAMMSQENVKSKEQRRDSAPSVAEQIRQVEGRERKKRQPDRVSVFHLERGKDHKVLNTTAGTAIRAYRSSWTQRILLYIRPAPRRSHQISQDGSVLLQVTQPRAAFPHMAASSRI